MLLELRADEREQGMKSPAEIAGVKAYAGVMGRAGLLEAIQRMLGALSGLISRNGRINRLPPPFSGWTGRRDFPAPAPQPFRRLWKRTRGIRPWTR
jgi:L-lactate dehydrogenase complex protein LldF